MRRLYIYAVAAAAMVTAVAAQEAEPALKELFACRIDNAQVRLQFKFESSPCWETTAPEVSAGSGEPADALVTIGTEATGDVCTMNLVVAEFDQALAIAEPANAVEVNITTPEGAVIGTGVAAVAEPGPECAAPTAVALAQ